MLEKKVIFIIPGYNHTPKNVAYQNIAKILKGEGYHPILISLPWKKATISENARIFLKKYKKIKTKKKYILGFSFGAIIAFITSSKVDVEGLILCSLSPYFKEDLSKLKKQHYISKNLKQRHDSYQLHCTELTKELKANQILLLYGENEDKLLIERVKETYRQISKNSKSLISISQTDHDIGDKKYLKKIHQAAKLLNYNSV